MRLRYLIGTPRLILWLLCHTRSLRLTYWWWMRGWAECCEYSGPTEGEPPF